MDAVNNLLLRLYALSREVPLEDFHERALTLLKTAVEFDSAIWGTGSMAAAGLTYHSVHLHNEPEDLPVAYDEVKHEDAASFHLWHLGPVFTSRFHIPTLYQGREKTAILAYSQRFGHQNALISGEINKDSGIASWIGCYRARPDRQYSPRDCGLVSLLAPHLQESLRLACLLHMERTLRKEPRGGRAIADARGALLHTEPEFVALMREEWPHWQGSTLTSNALDAFPSGLDPYRGQSIVLSFEPVGTLIFLKARRKSATDTLTGRERAVALQLKRGLSHKQIARALGIAPATARNHIQNIHRKLGAHSNAEIVERLGRD